MRQQGFYAAICGFRALGPVLDFGVHKLSCVFAVGGLIGQHRGLRPWCVRFSERLGRAIPVRYSQPTFAFFALCEADRRLVHAKRDKAAAGLLREALHGLQPQ